MPRIFNEVGSFLCIKTFSLTSTRFLVFLRSTTLGEFVVAKLRRRAYQTKTRPATAYSSTFCPATTTTFQQPLCSFSIISNQLPNLLPQVALSLACHNHLQLPAACWPVRLPMVMGCLPTILAVPTAQATPLQTVPTWSHAGFLEVLIRRIQVGSWWGSPVVNMYSKPQQ